VLLLFGLAVPTPGPLLFGCEGGGRGSDVEKLPRHLDKAFFGKVTVASSVVLSGSEEANE
jgi:hypothetical protein